MRFTHRDFRYLEYFRYLELNIKTQNQISTSRLNIKTQHQTLYRGK